MSVSSEHTAIRSGLSGAWRWWTSELAGSIPAALRAKLAPRSRALIMQWLGGEQVSFVADKKEDPLLPGKPVPTTGERPHWLAKTAQAVVLLPADQAVLARATLPAAAEKTLYHVVGYELDRLTPFARGEAAYDCRVASRNGEAETIGVDILAAPNSVIDDICALAKRWALPLGRIDVRGPLPGEGAGYNLLRGRDEGHSAQRIPAVTIALCLTLAALGFAGWASLHYKDRTLAKLEETLKERRASVAALSNDVNQALTSQNARAALSGKQNTPMAIDMLKEATLLLPDDSWLTRFRLNGDTLELRGYSAQAAALPTRFDQSPLFADVSFTAPIMQDERTGKQRFAMTMTVQMAAQEAL